jgi:YrhK-like protein
MSAAGAAVVTGRAAERDARRIGVLFMVGSACFAVASVPGASDVLPGAVGVTYFIGSIFFTSAGFEQLRTARGAGAEAWSAGVQFAGTLFFNVSTFAGMREALGEDYHELLVWTPDAFGSVCFLASSVLAAATARHDSHRARRIAAVNLLGSVAFGLSAIAAFIVPDSGELLDASLATSMTLAGAVCFFVAAAWLARPGLSQAAP